MSNIKHLNQFNRQRLSFRSNMQNNNNNNGNTSTNTNTNSNNTNTNSNNDSNNSNNTNTIGRSSQINPQSHFMLGSNNGSQSSAAAPQEQQQNGDNDNDIGMNGSSNNGSPANGNNGNRTNETAEEQQQLRGRTRERILRGASKVGLDAVSHRNRVHRNKRGKISSNIRNIKVKTKRKLNEKEKEVIEDAIKESNSGYITA